MKELYTRREAIVAGLLGLAVIGMVWSPAILRPFGYPHAVDLQTLHLPEDRPVTHVRRSSSPARITKAKPTSRVDINHADVPTLQTLPGIGPTLAQRIIAHRKTNGPFADTRELLEVDGIGPKRFDKIEPWVGVR